MKKLLSSFIKTSMLCSVALIALGLLLIIKSEATIITISYVIGGLLIALGVIAEIKYFNEHAKKFTLDDIDIVYGIVCVILGIIVIKNPEAIASIIPLVIGVIIIANSAVKLQYSIELKKDNSNLWISTLILSIIMLVCGVLLVFNPFKGAVLLTRIVGVFILIYAVLDLVSTFCIRNTLVKIQKAVQEDVTDAQIIEEKETKKLEDSKEEKKKSKEKEDKTEEESDDDKEKGEE